MKQNILLAIFIFCSFSLFAQTTEPKEEISKDPLDVSIQKEQIEKYGIPTLSTVEEMKNKADVLYDSQSWEEAAAAYKVYVEHVTWLANLLEQCIEPYYSASYDEQKRYSHIVQMKNFSRLAKKANECKKDRNHAYVKMGLCYKNIGDIKKAVTYLYKSLDLIDVTEMESWTFARDAMVEIIEFKDK